MRRIFDSLLLYTSQRPGAPFAFLALVVLIVSLAGGLGFFVASGKSSGVWQSLFWAFTRAIDTGSLNEDWATPPAVRALSLGISVIGLVLVGGLIGFIASGIQTVVLDIRDSADVTRLEGHYILVGFGPRMIPVLRALLLRGADSFVVFSKLPGQKIRQSLKEANVDGSKASVYPVRGELVQASDLERASFARARGVIFLQEGFAKTISDFVMMRSLHVLYPNNKIDSQTVVLELCDHKSLKSIGGFQQGAIPYVSERELVSKTLLQCARFGGYGRVFEELFLSGRFSTHRKGSSGLEGVIFSDLLAASVTHIPLGVLLPPLEAGSDAKLVLNPPSDYEIEDGDQIFWFGPAGRSVQLKDLHQATPPQTAAARPAKGFSKVLIHGNSECVPILISELSAHSPAGVDIVWLASPSGDNDPEEASHAFAVSNSSIKEGGLSVLRADFFTQDVLERAELDDLDAVFLLADDALSVVEADSKTLGFFHDVKAALGAGKVVKQPAVFAEVETESTGKVLEASGVDTVLVREKWIGLQMAELAVSPDFHPVFKELLSAGGVEIAINNVSDYFVGEEPLSVESVLLKAQSLSEIPIAFLDSSGNVSMITEHKFAPTKLGTKLVVMGHQIYS